MFVFAQGLVGCGAIANMPPAMLGEVVGHWPMFLFGVVSVILISGFLGWVMARLGLMPGTTVVWGLSPGAAAGDDRRDGGHAAPTRSSSR